MRAMARCSLCNCIGHNTRTCSTRTGGGSGGLRLFGVSLTDGSSVKKSASMGNISHYSAPADSPEEYHSDDPNLGSAVHRPMRKKGIPWTEEEHRKFLVGLQKLGKGDWRGISKHYVPSRTPSQVASHAQKYFIHQSNATRKSKRSSLLGIAPDMETNPSMPELSNIPSPAAVGINNKNIMLLSSEGANMDNTPPSLDLSLQPAFMTSPFQLWPPNAYSLKDDGAATPYQQIFRPVPVVPDEPIKDMASMSQLTLGETGTIQIEPSALSLSPPGKLSM